MSRVAERSFETSRVAITPSIITKVRYRAESSELEGNKLFPTRKIVIILINIGNLPLQGTKLLVRIANNLSLGDSIIRAPITPQALQPNPIHIVRACLPCAEAFLNRLSKLKAMRGKRPESSSKVNRGKNIAIGGSITDTIQATVLYIPFTITMKGSE